MSLKKVKVKSNLLGKTYEVDVYEVLDCSNKSCLVIPHKSLEAIAAQESQSVSVKIVKSKRDHAVVVAKVGITTQIGEVVSETLKGAWKKYPVTCAMQRAQDRAILIHMQLPGKKPYYPLIEEAANYKTKIIRSNTLNKDIMVNCLETVTSSKSPCLILSHNSLEKILIQENLEMKFKVMEAEKEHSVVLANLGDVTEIGESVPETLKNSNWINYPVTVAWIRAMDRALIKYLGLASNLLIYSSVERIEESVNDPPDLEQIKQQAKTLCFNYGVYKNVPICNCPLSFLRDFVAGNIPGFQTAETMKNIVTDYLKAVDANQINHVA